MARAGRKPRSYPRARALFYTLRTMKAFALAMLVLIYWCLHQDTWFWRSSQPMALGFLPPGLWYHALYTVGASLLLWVLVRLAWPSELERETDHE